MQKNNDLYSSFFCWFSTDVRKIQKIQVFAPYKGRDSHAARENVCSSTVVGIIGKALIRSELYVWYYFKSYQSVCFNRFLMLENLTVGNFKNCL